MENENKKFYLSEFTCFDGEFDITFNIIDVDFHIKELRLLSPVQARLRKTLSTLHGTMTENCSLSTANSLKTKYRLTTSRR